MARPEFNRQTRSDSGLTLTARRLVTPDSLTGAKRSLLSPARHSLKSARAFVEAFAKRWASLCDTYAPHAGEESLWRHHSVERLVQEQGWKLHLSATLLSAVDLFERCAEALGRSGGQFKVAASFEASVK